MTDCSTKTMIQTPMRRPRLVLHECITGAPDPASSLDSVLQTARRDYCAVPGLVLYEHRIGAPRILPDGTIENGGVKGILRPETITHKGAEIQNQTIDRSAFVCLDIEDWRPFTTCHERYTSAMAEHLGLPPGHSWSRVVWEVESANFLIKAIKSSSQQTRREVGIFGYPDRHPEMRRFPALMDALDICFPAWYPQPGALSGQFVRDCIADIEACRSLCPGKPIVPFLSPQIDDNNWLGPSEFEGLLSLALHTGCDGVALWADLDHGDRARKSGLLAAWLQHLGLPSYAKVAGLDGFKELTKLAGTA